MKVKHLIEELLEYDGNKEVRIVDSGLITKAIERVSPSEHPIFGDYPVLIRIIDR